MTVTITAKPKKPDQSTTPYKFESWAGSAAARCRGGRTKNPCTLTIDGTTGLALGLSAVFEYEAGW